MSSVNLDPAARCRSRNVNAAWLEALVWEDCATWVRNPGERLAAAQAKLRERMAASAGTEEQRRALLHQIAEKESERERVLTMYRRGRITMDEADGEMEEIAQESASLRGLLESIRSQDALTAAAEAHLTHTALMLTQLRDRVDEIERTGDTVAMREVIDLLVSRITVTTQPGELRKHKPASIAITYAFAEPRVEHIASATASGRRC